MITNLKGKNPNKPERMIKYLDDLTRNKLGTLISKDIEKHMFGLKSNEEFVVNEYISNCGLFTQLEKVYQRKKCARKTMSAGVFIGNLIKGIAHYNDKERHFIISKGNKCNVYKLCKR